MSVIRRFKKEDYTQMSNYHLKDKNLSLKAVGLLSKILGLPEDWVYSVKGLAALCKENKDTVGKIINELVDAGYIQRERNLENAGQFCGYIYTIYEEPPFARTLPGPKSSDPVSSDMVPPGPKSSDPEKPDPESSDLLITKEINNLNNNPPIVPPVGTRTNQTDKMMPKCKPDRFEKFWAWYKAIPGENGEPRNENRSRAVKAWDELKPDDALIDTIARALQKQLATKQWQQGIGIPQAATYLNQRRWEDAEDLPEPKRQNHAPNSTGWAPDPEVM